MRLASLGLAVTLSAATADAASLTFVVEKAGDDVIVTASGAINTTGFGLTSQIVTIAGVNPGIPALIVSAPGSALAQAYFAAFLSDPLPLLGDNGPFLAPTSGSGDRVGFTVSAGPVLLLPVDYVSGAPISAAMTFASASLASLRFMPGTATFDLVGGQSLAVTIRDATVVPLPPAALLLLPALSLLGFAGRRRG